MNRTRIRSKTASPNAAGRARGAGRTRNLAALAAALAGLQAAAGQPLQWRWAHPLPHGNHIYDLAAAPDGRIIQVGDRGRVYTSFDLALWTPRPVPTQKALRGVTAFGDRIIICGEAGLILHTLTNSLNQWTLVDLGTEDWLESVAGGEGTVAAVGDNGAVAVSTNCADWTLHRIPDGPWLRSVAWGAGRFVAVGENGYLATSPDGLSWTPRDSRTVEHLNRVYCTGSRFLAVGNQGVAIVSDDGLAWHTIDTGASGNLYAVAGDASTGLVAGEGEARLLLYGAWRDEIGDNAQGPAPNWSYYAALWLGDGFLLAGRSGMLVWGSPSGSFGKYLWEELSSPLRLWLWGACRWHGRFYAVGDYGLIASSAEGANWEPEAPAPGATNTVLLEIAAAPVGLVAAGTAGALLYSADGVAWEKAASPTDNDLQGLAWFQGRLYAAGGEGVVLSSPDGLAWTQTASLGSVLLTGAAADEQALVVCGENGALFYSHDGAHWSPVELGTTNWIYRVRRLGDRFVAVGENGSIFLSENGEQWIQADSGTTAWLTDVALLDGRLYAVGLGGVWTSSTDGAQWTAAELPSKESFFALAASDSQLVAVGPDGMILRAHEGRARFLEYDFGASTNLFLLSSIPGDRGALESAENLAGPWTSAADLGFYSNDGILVLSVPRQPAVRRFFRVRIEGTP